MKAFYGYQAIVETVTRTVFRRLLGKNSISFTRVVCLLLHCGSYGSYTKRRVELQR